MQFSQSTMKLKTALLVVDMQNLFIPDTTAKMMANVAALNHYFESRDLPRAFTQHGHTEEELSGQVVNQIVRRWGPDGSIRRGSHDWQLMADIAPMHAGNDLPMIHKNTYDAFLNTQLDTVLGSRGVGRVVVCGVQTEMCCDTSARGAFNRGYETWLVADACGTTDAKAHRLGLDAFAAAYGDVISTEEVLERLRKEQE